MLLSGCAPTHTRRIRSFFVGAALQTADDSIFTGVNVENASLGFSMCAERAAACAAVTAGHRVFRAIAVAGPVGAHAAPCGTWRQFLAEFNLEMLVTYSVLGGNAHVPLSELLPDSFKGETLRA